ncbi:MAG: hypothetical protein ACJA1N_002373 [Saprospiraceae bacterium]|jgi:hypothetical protein
MQNPKHQNKILRESYKIFQNYIDAIILAMPLSVTAFGDGSDKP